MASEDRKELGQKTEGSTVSTIKSLIRELTYKSGVYESKLTASALYEIGAPAVPFLVEALRLRHWGASREAAKILGRLGKLAHAAIPALTEALQTDPKKGLCLRDVAASSLGLIGDRSSSVALIGALKDPDDSVRDCAAEALGRIGEPKELIIPALVEATKDSARNVRRNAIVALGVIPESATVSIPILTAALTDKEQFVRTAAGKALENLGGPALAVPAYIATLAHHYARDDAVEALKQLGKEAIDGLNKARRDKSETIRVAVVNLLASIAPDILSQSNVETKEEPHILSEEDKRILAWFKDVNLTEYRTPLQVFWCIGVVDQQAMQSAGNALGWGRLKRRLDALKPTFKRVRVPTSVESLKDRGVEAVDGLFDKQPFYGNAWSKEERGLPLREEWMNKNRRENKWTMKAWKAWKYINLFLTVEDLLPQIKR